jgi:phage gpG-like protein
MQITLSITDKISGALAAGISKATSRDMAEAVGAEVVGIGQRAFNDPSLRPAQWPAKKGGGAATLKVSGALWHSLRIVAVTGTSVTVGSDRPYASIHQLGGRTKAHKITPRNGRALYWPGAPHPMKSVNHPGSNIPARPYFPIDASEQLTSYASQSIASILAAKLRNAMKA